MSRILVIIATINPDKIREQIANFLTKAEYPNNIMFGVKIDHGDLDCVAAIQEACPEYNSNIVVFYSPRGQGYYSLHLWYQKIYEWLSGNACALIFPVNDEVRFVSPHWDSELLKSNHHFADGIYKFKISLNRYRNHYCLKEVLRTPENYPIFTPSMLNSQGGIGDCWGPDGWSALFDFFIGQIGFTNGMQGVFRSIPLPQIRISNEQAGVGLDSSAAVERTIRILSEWIRLCQNDVISKIKSSALDLACRLTASEPTVQSVCRNGSGDGLHIYFKNGSYLETKFLYDSKRIRRELLEWIISDLEKGHFLWLKAAAIHPHVYKLIPYRLRLRAKLLGGARKIIRRLTSDRTYDELKYARYLFNSRGLFQALTYLKNKLTSRRVP